MNLKPLFLPAAGRIHLLLNLLGVIILLSGLGGATSIWLAQDRIDRQMAAGGTDATGPLSPEDSRRYTHDVEMYYGETGMLMDKWERWWERMTHGKPLAETMAVVSLAAAGGLFYFAARTGHPRRGPGQAGSVS